MLPSQPQKNALFDLTLLSTEIGKFASMRMARVVEFTRITRINPFVTPPL